MNTIRAYQIISIMVYDQRLTQDEREALVVARKSIARLVHDENSEKETDND